MSTRAITKADFNALVSQPGLVLIDWWAPWCGPCRVFGPVFEKASDANPDVSFAKIDVDEAVPANRAGGRNEQQQ